MHPSNPDPSPVTQAHLATLEARAAAHRLRDENTALRDALYAAVGEVARLSCPAVAADAATALRAAFAAGAAWSVLHRDLVDCVLLVAEEADRRWPPVDPSPPPGGAGQYTPSSKEPPL